MKKEIYERLQKAVIERKNYLEKKKNDGNGFMNLAKELVKKKDTAMFIHSFGSGSKGYVSYALEMIAGKSFDNFKNKYGDNILKDADMLTFVDNLEKVNKATLQAKKTRFFNALCELLNGMDEMAILQLGYVDPYFTVR